jgi:hypothetical protein
VEESKEEDRLAKRKKGNQLNRKGLVLDEVKKE